MKNKSFITESILARTCKGLPEIFLNKWFLFLLLICTAGCKKVIEQDGLVSVCPEVILTSPTDTAKGISLTKRIDASFNKAMDPSSINSSTFTVLQGTKPVTGVVSYAGVMASFTPTTAFLPNTAYTGTINTGAKDPAGNAMISNYVWRFTTGEAPDTTAPTVTSTDPENAAINVAINKKISATFSEVMDISSITTASFVITNTTLDGSVVAGAVSYSGTTAVFTPTIDLFPNNTYAGTIKTTAKDLAGNVIKTDYVWSFTTGALADAIAPTVILTDPLNLATGVPFNKKIAATFSEAMDPATIAGTTFTLKQGTTVVAASVSYAGMTATISPSANLAPSTIYTATITTAAKDLAGNALASNYVWTFTTGIAADVVAPTIISTDPANLATGVVLNKKIIVSFSEAMDPLTLTTTTFTLKNGAVAVPGTVVYAGIIATFSPTGNLAPNTTYTGTITTGAKDLAGNAVVNNYVWSFTTGAAPDVAPPTVISTDPVNAAIGVLLNKKITASFSEAMNPLTINNASFGVKQGNTIILGVVTYTGTTATFTPATDLVSNTLYTATIKTGAKDLAGNSLANDFVWSFTTLQVIVVIPPSLGTASMFGVFGGSAGITNQGLNTVINNGSIGTTAASTLITGFHDGTTNEVYTETPLNVGLVTGRIYTAPPAPGTATSFAVAVQGLADATVAYLGISPASKPGGSDPGAGELGGLTLAPGIYKSASGAFNITNGDLTLDGKGDANAIWIFQTASALTVGVAGPAGARSVKLINGALAKNVFWYVGSAATINGAGGGVMVGNILASAGVTFSTAGNSVQTVLNGRALSLNASVTLVNTTINVP